MRSKKRSPGGSNDTNPRYLAKCVFGWNLLVSFLSRSLMQVLAMKAVPHLIALLVATALGVEPRAGIELVHQP